MYLRINTFLELFVEAITLCLLLNKCGLYIYRKVKFSFPTPLRITGGVDVHRHTLTSTVDNDGLLT